MQISSSNVSVTQSSVQENIVVWELSLPTNDKCIYASCMSFHNHNHKNLYGGLTLGVNTLYRLFCFFNLFPIVGKGLKINYRVVDRLPGFGH